MPDTALSISEIRSGKVCVVALAGRIDSTNSEQLLGRLAGLFSAGEQAVLVDFNEVVYLTSAAFRTLLVAGDQAQGKAALLVLCGVIGQVRDLFEMGGLLDAFAIHGSRDDALAKLA